MNNFSKQASNFLTNVFTEIYPFLLKGDFKKVVNSIEAHVTILNDDASTVWVKWGIYDDKLRNLPVTAIATLADSIIEENE